LAGLAVSPGLVTGRASVVLSRTDVDAMEPGTILICPALTPAWTSLLGLAAGLVTEDGGVLAHGAIVAREYGVPAVMGLGDATGRIRSGQRIAIDGNTGTVTLLADEA
jgi:pyruvate,water dikinase